MKNMIINECMQKLNVRVSQVDYVECSKEWRQEYYFSPRSAIGYIKAGEGYFMLEEYKFFPQKGQMYFLPEQYRHSFAVTNPDNTFRKYYCHFNTLPGAINIFNTIKVPPLITPRNSEYVEGLFEEMIQLEKQKENYLISLKIKIILYQILEHYLESCGIENIQIKQYEKQEVIGEILKFIETNLDKRLTVKEVADQFGYSAQYFAKFFKQNFGETFLQYINASKMEKARYYIIHSHKSMSEIADALGFENQYYFSNAFKKENGMSPTDYKKMYIKI